LRFNLASRGPGCIWADEASGPSAQPLVDVEDRKDGNDRRRKLAELSDDVELMLIEAERDLVNTLYRSGELKDEGRRRIERELDLRDTLLVNLRSSE